MKHYWGITFYTNVGVTKVCELIKSKTTSFLISKNISLLANSGEIKLKITTIVGEEILSVGQKSKQVSKKAQQ